MVVASTRLIAALLLCSCAPVVAPSSLPYVRIDPSLPGAVASRTAAEVFVTKRLQDAAKCEASKDDIRTELKICDGQRLQALIAASRISWWEQHGLLLVIGAAVVFFAGGALAGYGFAEALAK